MITVTEHGDVAEITLDRHEKRNALDLAHLTQLTASVGKCVSAGSRALVITGAGSTFSAGADLGGVYGDGFRAALYTALGAITSAPIPVLAAVNGPAIGAGTQLAIACDLRIVAPTAKFAVPTARNGLAVDPWTIRRLAALAGGATTRALLLAADTLDAPAALTRGLADRIGSTDDARALAREIASYAPLSLKYSKHAVQALTEPGTWETRLDEEFEQCWASADFTESQLARAENRMPKFVGK
ncbi:enoyl-CoA hydratase [Nocardia jinanensis]|uniref:Enoyl-CoA hydratase n=1 Tax=Nocardia jinanensis TaxID=382504 RepID=A0A917RLF2_9NOCA|nr:enoyl-CoA hydratase [Nocardia jinanensis]GGL13905.1 enoyl-CoA hydratase [Nocardia jinanensis]